MYQSRYHTESRVQYRVILRDKDRRQVRLSNKRYSPQSKVNDRQAQPCIRPLPVIIVRRSLLSCSTWTTTFAPIASDTCRQIPKQNPPRRANPRRNLRQLASFVWVCGMMTTTPRHHCRLARVSRRPSKTRCNPTQHIRTAITFVVIQSFQSLLYREI